MGVDPKSRPVSLWRDHTEGQQMLICCIVFLAIVGGLTWLRYFSEWAWGP